MAKGFLYLKWSYYISPMQLQSVVGSLWAVAHAMGSGRSLVPCFGAMVGLAIYNCGHIIFPSHSCLKVLIQEQLFICGFPCFMINFTPRATGTSETTSAPCACFLSESSQLLRWSGGFPDIWTTTVMTPSSHHPPSSLPSHFLLSTLPGLLHGHFYLEEKYFICWGH